jgi:hypothetical protein
MFERRKTIIRNRLLLKGYRAELLDSLGISDEVEIDNAPVPSIPVPRPLSDLPASGPQPQPGQLARDAKLNELISELHDWLDNGPIDVRTDFMKSLRKKVRFILPPGIDRG